MYFTFLSPSQLLAPQAVIFAQISFQTTKSRHVLFPLLAGQPQLPGHSHLYTLQQGVVPRMKKIFFYRHNKVSTQRFKKKKKKNSVSACLLQGCYCSVLFAELMLSSEHCISLRRNTSIYSSCILYVTPFHLAAHGTNIPLGWHPIIARVLLPLQADLQIESVHWDPSSICT